MDSNNILKCPACGEEMEKVFVSSANCNVDICVNGCGGIFFDNREYQKFDEKHESIDEIKNLLKGKQLKDVDKTFKRVCPVCGMKMIKNSTSIKRKIIIDECYGCGGKFLDCNELDEIRNEYDTEEERKNDVINFLKANMGQEFEDMHAYKKVSDMQPEKQGLFGGFFKKFF